MTAKRRLGALLAVAIAGTGCNNLPNPTFPTATQIDLFFASQVMANGATSRTFNVPKGGEVKVLFTSLLPESDRTISIAIGTSKDGICTPTSAVDAVAGSTSPILTTTLTAGDYCLRVADTGSLTKTNDYSITITVPAA